MSTPEERRYPPAAVMPDETCPVRWTGRQAMVTLPQHLDSSNADQIREQLLWIINRGAAVLIVDLTRTVSCTYSGRDALARAYERAAANGTELRLAATADVVLRMLAVTGLDRLVAVYPGLDGALAAEAEPRQMRGERRTTAAGRDVGPEELLHLVVASIFDVGLILNAAIDLPPDGTARRITDALRRLDEVVREVRSHVLAGRDRGLEAELAWRPSPEVLARSALAKDRATVLRRHVAETARALNSAAADTAALLERRADLVGEPGPIDYRTEIKRLRVLADQAGQMADRWQQP
jgi:anti-anti-sigma factor